MVTKRTKALIKTVIAMSVPFVAFALYLALVFYRPPMPGDQPNPKLVEMFNRAIDASFARLAEPHSLYSLDPPHRPDAADNARRWLSEVREVVTHCRYGEQGMQNPHVIDITLQSGEVSSDLTASFERCLVHYDTPMRVTFQGGRVVQVTTDGSERESTPEVAESRVKMYVDALVRRDIDLHPERYFLEPNKPDPAKAWDTP